MLTNSKKRNLKNDKLITIFNSNIPKKKYFNSLINNTTPIILNSNFCADIQNEINQISKFNPYDSEINYNYKGNKNYYNYNYNENKKMKKKKSNKGIKKRPKKLKNITVDYGKKYNDKFDDEKLNQKLFIQKINSYINNSSDDEDDINDKDLTYNFFSPKLKQRINNNNNMTKISQYSIKNNNKNDKYFTDFKKGLSNIRIKSTNFSSNISYDNNNNEYKKRKTDDISPFNTFNNTSINKRNRSQKKLNRKKINTLIKRKDVENKTDQKQGKKTPMLRSTVVLSKKLRSIDEFTGIKRNKSKPKHSRFKKRKESYERNDNPLKIKNNINSPYKKENHKFKSNISSKELKKINKKNYFLEEENENISKNVDNKDNKKIDSIPKIKKNKRNFLYSFFCCLGFDENEIEDKDKLNKSNDNKIIFINSDNNSNNNNTKNNKLNNKKVKSKSSKKKKRKKSDKD